jgi:hypothetical protein
VYVCVCVSVRVVLTGWKLPLIKEDLCYDTDSIYGPLVHAYRLHHEEEDVYTNSKVFGMRPEVDGIKEVTKYMVLRHKGRWTVNVNYAINSN